MSREEAALYAAPFSRAYWREARACAKGLRLLVFAALMIAMARALSLIPSIPIGHTRLSFGFLARSLCALVCGPVLGMIYGFAEDILGYILQPEGEFFFGYTLSTMAGMLVYALCFFRSRITVLRLTVANILVNFLVNAALGSLWSWMLRGSTYWAWFWPSLGKNALTLVPKVILLYILYQALLPSLQKLRLIPKQVEGRIRLI